MAQSGKLFYNTSDMQATSRIDSRIINLDQYCTSETTVNARGVIRTAEECTVV